MTEDWIRWLIDTLRVLIEKNDGYDIDIKKKQFFPQDVKDYLSGIYAKVDTLLKEEQDKLNRRLT